MVNIIYVINIIYETTGNKSECMKMCSDEKGPGLQRMGLFIELLANVKRFGF